MLESELHNSANSLARGDALRGLAHGDGIVQNLRRRFENKFNRVLIRARQHAARNRDIVRVCNLLQTLLQRLG
jgi:hypothetical protein